MTKIEFNEKYKDFLEDNHYGLSIDIPELTAWLDVKFQQFIQNPKFTYSQIKLKLGMGVFYCTGVSQTEMLEVDRKITEFSKK
jgi:hypothetical protein